MSNFFNRLFFITACFFTGGVSGIIVGVQVIRSGHDVLSDLDAYFVGGPIGALVGLILGLFIIRTLSVLYRFWLGACILALGIGMAVRIYVLFW